MSSTPPFEFFTNSPVQQDFPSAGQPFGLLPGFVPQSTMNRSETEPAHKRVPSSISSHKRTMSENPMLSPDSTGTTRFRSPMRHHRRTPSMRTEVKETLNAHSDITTHRINQYKLGKEIGHGAYGSVLSATDPTGQEYAVKEFSKSRLRRRNQSQLLRARGPGRMPGPGGRRPPVSPRVSIAHLDSPVGAADPLFLIREEIAVMKKLHHENLVQLIEVLDDPDEDSLYMVLEMCKRGVVQKFDEDKHATPLGEEPSRLYFRDLILGIEYLHHQGIIHRDIKPDNLLLNDEDVMKISDFGVSEMFAMAEDRAMKVTKDAGSPAFMAPELCRARRGDVAGKAIDIWAMGVTLFCFRYGKIPFDEGDNVLEMYNNICTQEVKLPEDESPEFVDLMSRILDKSPETRIKMAELREHPWVTRNGEDPLLSAEENCEELIERPNDLELSRALTRRTSNLLMVMKVLHKLKSRVAARKAREARNSMVLPPPEDIASTNTQIAAELSQRRELFRARAKERGNPGLFVVPADDDDSVPAGVSPGYLGIGTGSSYHVPKQDSDRDYVAESPTEVTWDVEDRLSEALATQKKREDAIMRALEALELKQTAVQPPTVEVSSEDGPGNDVCPVETSGAFKAVRVDSGYEDGCTDGFQKTEP